MFLYLATQARHTKTQHQLQVASKQEQEVRLMLQRSDAQRQEQERRLETASSQVAGMRAELQTLNARLAARDQQLLKHVEVRTHLCCWC